MDVIKLAKNVIFSTTSYCSEHSSEICMIVAGVTSVVALGAGIKATIDIQGELEEKKKKIEEIKEKKDVAAVSTEDGEVVEVEVEMDDETYKKELAKAYGSTILTIAKYYGIPVALEIISLITMFESNKISRKRNAELAAGLTAVQAMYDKYRAGVIERYGEEEDRNIRLGLHKEKQDTEYIDENGKKKKKKEEVEVQDTDKIVDIWTRCFDESSINWNKDFMLNTHFVKMQESAANDMCCAKRYITVNEVYYALDVPQSELGQTWGWVWDPNGPSKQIDFGIYDIENPQKRAFVNGYERNIFIDFAKTPPVYIGDKVWGKHQCPGIANSRHYQ